MNATPSRKLVMLPFFYILALKAFCKPIKVLIQNEDTAIFVLSVYHMKETGFEVISEEDCTELHYRYKEEKQK